MKQLFAAVIMLFATIGAHATTVTGTVTDSDSIAWANGNVTFKLTGTGGPYSCAGTAMTPDQLTVVATMDGSGAFSTTLCDNSTITPVNSQWSMQVCSAATAPCQFIAATTVSGSSQSLTSYINGLIQPIRLSASTYGTRAYADVEILSPVGGTQYWNLATASFRYNNGTAWNNTQSQNLISHQVLASPASTISFANIPGTFKSLHLVFTGSATSAAGFNAVYLQFNGDTSAIYQSALLYNNGSTAAAITTTNGSKAQIATISDTASPAQAGGSIVMDIPNYATPNFAKTISSTGGAYITNPQINNTFYTYYSANPVTSILLGLINAGQFATNTIVDLYGVN